MQPTRPTPAADLPDLLSVQVGPLRPMPALHPRTPADRARMARRSGPRRATRRAPLSGQFATVRQCAAEWAVFALALVGAVALAVPVGLGAGAVLAPDRGPMVACTLVAIAARMAPDAVAPCADAGHCTQVPAADGMGEATACTR